MHIRVGYSLALAIFLPSTVRMGIVQGMLRANCCFYAFFSLNGTRVHTRVPAAWQKSKLGAKEEVRTSKARTFANVAANG